MAPEELVIETQRLLLRPLGVYDLDAMSALLSDSEALALWGPPLDRAGAEGWIRRNRARHVSDGFGRCAVIWNDTGELVGDCGLIVTEVEDVRLGHRVLMYSMRRPTRDG